MSEASGTRLTANPAELFKDFRREATEFADSSPIEEIIF
jgi:hypothetical protein